jgi:hypothetical protein
VITIENLAYYFFKKENLVKFTHRNTKNSNNFPFFIEKTTKVVENILFMITASN